mmetsp:Transcript_57800/g.161301  ORF Transcript_57800/g.161301 Transcript_57800/m.161301 type:complete len:245 (+) Transcript_57800:360-1094(+)
MSPPSCKHIPLAHAAAGFICAWTRVRLRDEVALAADGSTKTHLPVNAECRIVRVVSSWAWHLLGWRLAEAETAVSAKAEARRHLILGGLFVRWQVVTSRRRRAAGANEQVRTAGVHGILGPCAIGRDGRHVRGALQNSISRRVPERRLLFQIRIRSQSRHARALGRFCHCPRWWRRSAHVVVALLVFFGGRRRGGFLTRFVRVRLSRALCAQERSHVVRFRLDGRLQWRQTVVIKRVDIGVFSQ